MFWSNLPSSLLVLFCLVFASASTSAHASVTLEHELDFILERSLYSKLDVTNPHWIISEHNQTVLADVDHQIKIGKELLSGSWVKQKLISSSLADARMTIFFSSYLPSALHVFLENHPDVLFEHTETHLQLWAAVNPADRIIIFKKHFDQILHMKGHAREDYFKQLLAFTNQQSMPAEERAIYDAVLKQTSIEEIRPGLLDCIIDLTTGLAGKIINR